MCYIASSIAFACGIWPSPPFPLRESELAVILFDSVCDIGASHAIGNSAHFSLVALAKVETAKICCWKVNAIICLTAPMYRIADRLTESLVWIWLYTVVFHIHFSSVGEKRGQRLFTLRSVTENRIGYSVNRPSFSLSLSSYLCRLAVTFASEFTCRLARPQRDVSSSSSSSFWDWV